MECDASQYAQLDTFSGPILPVSSQPCLDTTYGPVFASLTFVCVLNTTTYYHLGPLQQALLAWVFCLPHAVARYIVIVPDYLRDMNVFNQS